MAKRSDFKSVEEYIGSFPKDVQLKLQNLRVEIRKLIPGFEEVISYQIPCFKLNGKYVIYFAAFKDHISLYPIPVGPKSFRNEIAPYVKGKGTISFPINEELPINLIANIVKFAVKANEKKVKK